MNILILQKDLFHFVGGGETVYGTIISCNPEIEFYYFCDEEPIDFPRPQNAHPIKLPQRDDIISIFRAADFIRNESCHTIYFERTIKDFLDFLCASLPDVVFDIVDIPDYALVGDLIRGSMETRRVKYKKIVVSLHGTQSASLESGWVSTDALNLRNFEKRQCLTADAVYGISERYMHERLEGASVSSFCLDPFVFVRENGKKYVKKFDFPQLACVGRKIRRKGADLFVELLRWVSPDCYSNAIIIGPDHHAGDGLYGDDYIQKCASNRNLTVQCSETYSHGQLEELFSQNTLLVLPVRNDMFNLVALEALFSGCPVAISDGAGVCDYLDRYYPEIPYIKIKLDNFYECIKEIEFVLEHYDTYRAQLAESLRKVISRQTGSSIEKIYTEVLALPERERELFATEEISFAADSICDRSESLSPVSSYEMIARLLKDWYRMPEHSVSSCESKIQALYPILARCNVRQLYGEYIRPTEIPCPDLPDFFNGSFFSCSLWHELARILKICGKEQLAVMFELRAMRNLGRDHFGVLPEVCASLRRQGFTEEAQVAELMFSRMPDAVKADSIHAFLQQRGRSFFATSEPEYARIEDARYIPAPKVSVVVSLYNAAPKLRQFLTCLAQQTMAKRHEVELILEDSCSPADEWSVVREFLTSSPLSIFYGRSPSRETVQCAWNRGIKVARAPYLVLLGADEMLYPDALETLYAELESKPHLDWVVANAVQTEVDEHGLLVRDILKNDFHGGSTDICVNDNKYIRWNASMYRKNLHDKFGYYDSSYSNAGCTEFGYRILPHISVGHIDRTLGVYWDYPEIRVSNPFVNEIAQLRACFVFRTPGGAMYLSQNKNEQEILDHIRLSLQYRRCVCQHISTDIPYAASLAMLLKSKGAGSRYAQAAGKVLELETVLRSSLLLPKVVSEQTLRQTVETAFAAAKKIEAELRDALAADVEILLFNDFLHERFSFIGLDRSGKENISFIT